MRIFDKATQCAQGELVITRIKRLPADLVLAPSEGGYVVVGHSETGHHHVMDARTVEMYRQPKPDLYELFLLVKEPTALKHLRPFDTHEPILHAPGVYRVRRQREYVPEGWRPATD